MNRTFALLVAAAVLLAHMLAIHVGSNDALAPPFEVAHAAFRLARNFVQSGAFAWSPGLPNVESYPSLLWIALAVIPERLHMPVTTFAQVLSSFCALLTTWVLARFSPERLAGVIAPLLFVASGAVAAAAASGTEFSLAALLVTASFLAYERGQRLRLAVFSSLACVTRPECVGFVATLFVIDELRRRRDAPDAPPRRAMGLSFAAPALVVASVCALRWSISGHVLSPWAKPLTHFAMWPVAESLLYLRDYFVSTVAAMLIVFPLWYLVRGTLSGLGLRALMLTLAWCVIANVGGGGPQVLPFSLHMMPILAVLLVAVQEAMTQALDSTRRFMEPVVWSVFLGALALSALASKFPGNLGPLPLEEAHRAWMTRHAPARFGCDDQLGREGLAEEIDKTERLRGIGVFLRDHLDPRHSVLTPWPGAIGYLSGLRVIDALSRATPMPGMLRAEAWSAIEPRDLIAGLQQNADYIVPTLAPAPIAPTIEEIAVTWIEGLDVDPRSPERNARIRELLGAYEVLTVPAGHVEGPGGLFAERYHLARRRGLGLSPTLALELGADEFAVQAEHRSHDQVADLYVWIDVGGQRWFLAPDGGFVQAVELTARRSLLLHATGTRTIELVRAGLPREFAGGTLSAVLANPGAGRESGAVGDVVTAGL
ncbi:MAG TPA: hypothetical protein VMT18_06625 [Planctomycetota bacterium]|nr:hypothetical protein [Planctomycetota bacterium]